MLKLLARQRAVDSMFDERLPDRDWTLRRAWKEVLDSLERGGFASFMIFLRPSHLCHSCPQKLLLSCQMAADGDDTLD